MNNPETSTTVDKNAGAMIYSIKTKKVHSKLEHGVLIWKTQTDSKSKVHSSVKPYFYAYKIFGSNTWMIFKYWSVAL